MVVFTLKVGRKDSVMERLVKFEAGGVEIYRDVDSRVLAWLLFYCSDFATCCCERRSGDLTCREPKQESFKC